ncbi:MAG: YceI family protein [Deltaproteobacteria bacterium]|nr:MAG: YceI family protein [Deltaproteobacteria bacterium]
MRYRVTSGSLTVQARSRIHDTTTVWHRITGEIVADPEDLADVGPGGTQARFEVDMTAFDAGDFLKNRKLRKDFDLEAHPRASFALTGLTDVVKTGATFTATARGTLSWRGKQIELVLAGRGTLDDMAVSAHATFDLDIRRLGLSAPRFLMFKVEDEVTIAADLRGVAA